MITIGDMDPILMSELKDKISYGILQEYYPTLKEFGGEANDYQELKRVLDKYSTFASLYADDLYYNDIYKYCKDEQIIEYLKNTINIYSKISNNPIYKKIIEKYKW